MTLRCARCGFGFVGGGVPGGSYVITSKVVEKVRSLSPLREIRHSAPVRNSLPLKKVQQLGRLLSIGCPNAFTRSARGPNSAITSGNSGLTCGARRSSDRPDGTCCTTRLGEEHAPCRSQLGEDDKGHSRDRA